jgi:hypothetical protein
MSANSPKSNSEKSPLVATLSAKPTARDLLSSQSTATHTQEPTSKPSAPVPRPCESSSPQERPLSLGEKYAGAYGCLKVRTQDALDWLKRAQLKGASGFDEFALQSAITSLERGLERANEELSR